MACPRTFSNERVFDVASQFNRSADRLVDGRRNVQVARLNLQAGRKAKASAAYAAACAYLAAGTRSWASDGWDRQYELLFQLQLERAECEFLRSNSDAAEHLIDGLIEHATSKPDLAAAYFLKVQLYVVKSEHALAAACALTCLESLGITMRRPPDPGSDARGIRQTCGATWTDAPIESLLDLPLMTDPDLLAAMRLLATIFDAIRAVRISIWRVCCVAE